MRLDTRSRPAQILLVEDDPGEARLIREAFAAGTQPVHLSVVAEGDEALAFLRRQAPYGQALRPDLVLLSLQLPGKEGRALLAEIKSDPALRTLPAIVFTSSSAPGDINQSYELWANCYIVKPVDLAAFFQVIQGIGEFWLTVVALPPA